MWWCPSVVLTVRGRGRRIASSIQPFWPKHVGVNSEPLSLKSKPNQAKRKLLTSVTDFYGHDASLSNSLRIPSPRQRHSVLITSSIVNLNLLHLFKPYENLVCAWLAQFPDAQGQCVLESFKAYLLSFLQMHTSELMVTVCFSVSWMLPLPQARDSQKNLCKAHREHLSAMVRPLNDIITVSHRKGGGGGEGEDCP